MKFQFPKDPAVPCRSFWKFSQIPDSRFQIPDSNLGFRTPDRAFFCLFMAIRRPFPDGGPFGAKRPHSCRSRARRAGLEDGKCASRPRKKGEMESQ